MLVWLSACAVLAFGVGGARADWLSLCSKCLSPSVVERSGIGTAHATAVAKISRADAEGWCANWSPDDKSCVGEQLKSDDAKKTYHASADCVAGRITAIDGDTYKLAGLWTSGIAKGRTKWRGPDGKVLGDDNASNGLAIAQQWEVLCPGPAPRAGQAASRVVPPAASRAPAAPGGAPSAGGYAVGQVIEARYGREWVRGRITKIWLQQGAGANSVAYDVMLANGKRGIVPASMLRAPTQ